MDSPISGRKEERVDAVASIHPSMISRQRIKYGGKAATAHMIHTRLRDVISNLFGINERMIIIVISANLIATFQGNVERRGDARGANTGSPATRLTAMPCATKAPRPSQNTTAKPLQAILRIFT